MANKKLIIKQLAKNKGLRLADVAARLGISRISFQQSLARNAFGIDRLSEIADILECEIPDLFESSTHIAITCPHCGHELKITVS